MQEEIPHDRGLGLGYPENEGGMVSDFGRYVKGHYLLIGIASGISSSWKSFRSTPCPGPLYGDEWDDGRINVVDIDALCKPS